MMASIRMQVRREHAAVANRAVPRLGAQYHGARTVAEQHTSAAVLPVEDAGEYFSADDYSAVHLPGFDEVVGDSEAIHESRAHRLDIERRHARPAERSLQARGG